MKKFIWNLSACVFIVPIFKVLDFMNLAHIRKLGKETLGIYMLQTFIFENLMGRFIIPESLNFVVRYAMAIIFSICATIICYDIVKMLRKSNYANKVLLGTYKLKNK